MNNELNKQSDIGKKFWRDIRKVMKLYAHRIHSEKQKKELNALKLEKQSY
jgi:hypothetical protein